MPLIAVEFAFRGGASQDPPGRAGIGQLMASLLDEGAGALDDEAFPLRIEEEAVELSFIGRARPYRRLAAQRRRPQGARLRALRLALTEPRFDADPVERIRQSLLAGLRREASDPNMIASRAFYAEPVSRPSLWPLAAWHARDDRRASPRRDRRPAPPTLARDNLVVSVVGAIDAATSAAMLDDVFGGLPAEAKLIAGRGGAAGRPRRVAS